MKRYVLALVAAMALSVAPLLLAPEVHADTCYTTGGGYYGAPTQTWCSGPGWRTVTTCYPTAYGQQRCTTREW